MRKANSFSNGAPKQRGGDSPFLALGIGFQPRKPPLFVEHAGGVALVRVDALLRHEGALGGVVVLEVLLPEGLLYCGLVGLAAGGGVARVVLGGVGALAVLLQDGVVVGGRLGVLAADLRDLQHGCEVVVLVGVDEVVDDGGLEIDGALHSNG